MTVNCRLVFSLAESRLRYRTLRAEAREKGEGGSFIDTIGLFYAIGNYTINDVEAIM